MSAAGEGAAPASRVLWRERLLVSLPGGVLLVLVGVEAALDGVLSGGWWPVALVGCAFVVWCALVVWAPVRRPSAVVAVGPFVVLVGAGVASLSESGQASALGGIRAPLLLALLVAHVVAWLRVVASRRPLLFPGAVEAPAGVGASRAGGWLVSYAAAAPRITAWCWFATLLVPAVALVWRSLAATDEAVWQVIGWLTAGSVWVAAGGLVQVSGLHQLEHLGRVRDARVATRDRATASGRSVSALLLAVLLSLHLVALLVVPLLLAAGAWELSRAAWLTGLLLATGAVMASGGLAWVTRELWLRVRRQVVRGETAGQVSS